jgi:glyoxylase-like metal-dependent hydrolase (beta-lactamase superfamily II)/8-oxo-dGTP pyrophosphatase MutT (NUDIX family)
LSQSFGEIPQVEPPEPKDSALGILLRTDGGGGCEVLFARRARSSRFMPGHLAFPGGRMDAADGPEREGSWARCASREVEEEVGVRIAVESWIDVGERITPPMFPVRFRTRFFLASFPDGEQLPEEPPMPGEIDKLRFATPGDVLAEWARGESLLPPPAIPVLRVLSEQAGLPLTELAARVREQVTLEQSHPRIEFDPDVWVLPVRTRTMPPATHTNVWMPGGEHFAVVDPGSDEPGEIRRLLGVIERRRELGAHPALVLLTHQHPDHVGGAVEVARALDVPVRAHPLALEATGIAGDPIEEGDTIDLGGLTLRALHTPGHARGHLAFELVERKMLLAGDLLSGYSTILIFPPEGDLQIYLDSLQRISEGGFHKLLPSHGPPLPVRAVRKVVEHRMARLEKVRDELAVEPRGIDEIARAAYDDVPEMPDWIVEGQTLAQLIHLERQGAARRDAADERRWALIPSG